MSKVQTTSKVSMKLTSWINLKSRGARAKPLNPDTAHKPPHSPERAKGAPQGVREFLASESLLKMINNASYFTPNTHFALKRL